MKKYLFIITLLKFCNNTTYYVGNIFISLNTKLIIFLTPRNLTISKMIYMHQPGHGRKYYKDNTTIIKAASDNNYIYIQQ